MAEAGSWPSIRKYGLLSTTALLDLLEVQGPQRDDIESKWRPRSVKLRHTSYGEFVIRDQGPMPETDLKPLLLDMEPAEWYQLINGKTFFWADLHGLKKLLCAVRYRGRSHEVLTVRTRLLVERNLERMWLTGQNTGSTLSKKQRGRNTFSRVREYDAPWVTEVAIDYGVRDIADLIIRVEEWSEDRIIREVWSRDHSGVGT